MSKQNRSQEVRKPSEADYHKVFRIDAPLAEIAANVLQTPNSALTTPLVEDEESVKGASG